MGRHILILTGSPRKGGYTDKMVGAFIQGRERISRAAAKLQAPERAERFGERALS